MLTKCFLSSYYKQLHACTDVRVVCLVHLIYFMYTCMRTNKNTSTSTCTCIYIIHTHIHCTPTSVHVHICPYMSTYTYTQYSIVSTQPCIYYKFYKFTWELTSCTFRCQHTHYSLHISASHKHMHTCSCIHVCT